MVRAKRCEGLWDEVITDQRILKIAPPINMDSTREVTCVIEQNIFVAFNDTDFFIMKMLTNPLRRDQDFRMGVTNRVAMGVGSWQFTVGRSIHRKKSLSEIVAEFNILVIKRVIAHLLLEIGNSFQLSANLDRCF